MVHHHLGQGKEGDDVGNDHQVVEHIGDRLENEKFTACEIFLGKADLDGATYTPIPDDMMPYYD